MNAPREFHDVSNPTNYAPLTGMVTPPEWIADALCAQVDPEIFYVEKGGSIREALSVCRACPVTAECLDYALTNTETYGVWGGTSERQRRRLTGPTRTVACVECRQAFEVSSRVSHTKYCGEECRRSGTRRVHAASYRRAAS